MLSRLRVFFGWCAVALILLLLAWGATFSPSYQKCAEYSANQEAGGEQAKLSQAVARRSRIEVFLVCEGKVIDESSGTLTAIATIGIAGFTLTLWLTTSRQARLTRDAIDLARDEFIATHRPRIRVRGFQTLTDGVADEKVSVMFYYVNAGLTPATVTEIGSKIILKLGSGVVFDRTAVRGVTLASGEKEVFCVESDDLFIAKVFHEASRGTAARMAHLIGYIRYEDRSGRKREIGFCRIFDAQTERWVRVDESDYEYED